MKPIVRRWWLFWITAMTYGILGATTAMQAAISQISDEHWEIMFSKSFYSSRSFWILVTSIIIGFITPIRALMNGDYQKAKNGETADAKI